MRILEEFLMDLVVVVDTAGIHAAAGTRGTIDHAATTVPEHCRSTARAMDLVLVHVPKVPPTVPVLRVDRNSLVH